MDTVAIQALNSYIVELDETLWGLIDDDRGYRKGIELIKNRFGEQAFNQYYKAFKYELIQNVNEYDDDKLIVCYLDTNLEDLINLHIDEGIKMEIVKQNYEIRFLISLYNRLESVCNEVNDYLIWSDVFDSYTGIKALRDKLKKKEPEEKYFSASLSKVNIDPSVLREMDIRPSPDIVCVDKNRELSDVTKDSKQRDGSVLLPKICWEKGEESFVELFTGLIEKQTISLDGSFEKDMILGHLLENIYLNKDGSSRYRRIEEMPGAKLYWHESPRQFVSLFFDLISEKSLSYRSEYDMNPIVKELHNIFQIGMKRQKGVVKQSSLLTYFKKHKLGDSY